LNKNPTEIINKDELAISGQTQSKTIFGILFIIYKPSILVVPEFEYNKPDPNRIKQDDKPPKRKYIRPPDVANSEFLYKVDNIYNP
jgi:hypothetical protein